MDRFEETLRGQLLRYRARQRRRVLAITNGAPQSKTSADAEQTRLFQEALVQGLLVARRKQAMTGDVAVQLDFAVQPPNPPEVHTLAKHYLDVFQHPAPGLNIQRSRVLLQDDRQVKVLICNYHLAPEFGPGIMVRVAPLSDFVNDLEFVNRIRHERFDDARSIRWKDEWARLRRSHEDERLDELREQYRDLAKRQTKYEQAFGAPAFEAMRESARRDLQECLLELREPRPDQLGALYFPIIGAGHVRKELQAIRVGTSQMLKQLFETDGMSIDLGAPAVREGQSAEFRAAIASTLSEYRKVEPVMFPLLSTLGVTVLYLPPKDGHAQGIDLDNLARRVIPHVHAELRPPSNLAHTIQLEKLSKDLRGMWQSTLEKLKRTPRCHVTRYQVLVLPRFAGDPIDGRVRLVLHSGDGHTGPWDESESLLSDWADYVEREAGYGY